MRRFLSWHLPLTIGVIAAVVFAWGFFLGARGGAGETVLEVPETVPAAERRESGIGILVLGDSLARGAGDPTGLGISGSLQTGLAEREISYRDAINLGVDGATSAELVRQLGGTSIRRLVRESDLIVVSIGGNDLWREEGPVGVAKVPDDPDALMDEVLENIGQIVAMIRELNPEGRVFLIGLYNPFAGEPEGTALNARVNRWNAKLQMSFEDDVNLTVVQTADLFTHADRLSVDRFHPGAEAYRIIGRRIADAVGESKMTNGK